MFHSARITYLWIYPYGKVYDVNMGATWVMSELVNFNE